MAGAREQARERTRTAILAAARVEIAERGAGELSMRRIAREVGMVSSAVYRYFPTREALLTAMIVESYTRLASALGQVRRRRADLRWTDLGRTLRDWALARPHEFQLIYGTPVPGYVAPPETVPVAAAVAEPFLQAGAKGEVPPFGGRPLGRQVQPLTEAVDGATASGAAAVLAELAALVGMITLELSGHFVGTADPTDRLYAALLERQVATLGLAPGAGR